MKGNKSINIISGIFGVILFLIAFLAPFLFPRFTYWQIVKMAITITVAIILGFDFCLKKKEENDWKIGISTYKLVFLGFTALFSFWGSIEILPFYEEAKTLRGDMVLILALFTFEDALIKYFFEPKKG